MSDISTLPYSSLWQERVVRSVANLRRRDAEESSHSLRVSRRRPASPPIRWRPLARLGRTGRCTGAAVLVPQLMLAANDRVDAGRTHPKQALRPGQLHALERCWRIVT